jgi:hypothetical protein
MELFLDKDIALSHVMEFYVANYEFFRTNLELPISSTNGTQSERAHP